MRQTTGEFSVVGAWNNCGKLEGRRLGSTFINSVRLQAVEPRHDDSSPTAARVHLMAVVITNLTCAAQSRRLSRGADLRIRRR